MRLRKVIITAALIIIGNFHIMAQYSGWQQEVKYEMIVNMDVDHHQLDGLQKITYYNNSPDTLDKFYLHLYFNAFQPGSMMDIRSRTIVDPDKRVGDRIVHLKPDEQGYCHITSMKMNGAECQVTEMETILEAILPQGLAKGDSAVFEVSFKSQVPLQIRRSGRFNKEGVDYSMSQWYPKVCAYDSWGWHTTPYVGREFYGTFGHFDVTIWIPEQYMVGATGYLIEEKKIKAPRINGSREKSNMKKWRFVADQVHDFVWAADPEFKHTVHLTKDSVELHCYYIETERNQDSWNILPEIMDKALSYINGRFGKYPFNKYSFIQGGDGGMEYPMATLITGERSLGSLVGVSVHELMHHWYYMVLASNEALHPWMDEGFTSFATAEVMNYLRKEGIIPGNPVVDPHGGSYENYRYFAKTGREEPLCTPSDHYITNSAYGMGAYTKGKLFLAQMEYIIGKENFDKGLLAYYNEWKFKHPGPWDCLRVFEKISGMELDWYLHYWMNSTYTIDYAIDSIRSSDNGALIYMKRNGLMPMPVDLKVNLINGDSHWYTIPLRIQRKAKESSNGIHYNICQDWPWVAPFYTLELPYDMIEIESVQLNPTGRLADIEKDNDIWPKDDHSKRN